MKVLLCIPPTYERTYPPLGTPALTGLLRGKGIDVCQRDLNIEYYDYLKEKNFTHILRPSFLKMKKSKNLYYSHMILKEDYSNYPGVRLPYENNPGSSYTFVERILSSSLLFHYVKDPKENFFFNFFREKVIPQIGDQKIDLIGISIIAPSQVIAAFTLGYLIKVNLSKVHISIGGRWASLYKEELKNHPEFMVFFDTIIFSEGETPLYELIGQLSINGSLSQVPNLIYKSNSRFVKSSFYSEENLNSLPPPDFTGLPLSKYTCNQNGKVVLTIETARGCYWGRCAFCAHLYIPMPKYREKSPDLILRDIKLLIEKYKVNHLKISNVVFSPKQMHEISEKIIATNINISWDCLARLDEGFTKRTLHLAKMAGCTTIDFGLESINQRILNLIRKGNRRDVVVRVIEDCHKVGIDFYLQVMIGLPTETIEEALETIDFLVNYRKFFKSAVFNIYHLIPGNYIYKNPKEFCIRYKKSSRLPFKFFHEFEHKNIGYIDKRCAENLVKLCQKLGVPILTCQSLTGEKI